jgi:hypothetical protein
MNKEMVISSTPHETRVAILEDDQVVEVFIEREHSRGVVGNIYKGRVSRRLLPGMQSAFVEPRSRPRRVPTFQTSSAARPRRPSKKTRARRRPRSPLPDTDLAGPTDGLDETRGGPR